MKLHKSISTKGHFQKIGILTKEVLSAWRVLEKLKSDKK